MEKTVKSVKFSKTLSIIFAITALFYVGVSLIYFISMLCTLLFGGEYDMLGFIFGLIFLPLVAIALVIPALRIIILMLSLKMSKKLQESGNIKGLKTWVGVLQIVDGVGTPIIFGFIGSIMFVFGMAALNISIETGGILGLFYTVVGLTYPLPVLAKGIIQIISSVGLFKIKVNA